MEKWQYWFCSTLLLSSLKNDHLWTNSNEELNTCRVIYSSLPIMLTSAESSYTTEPLLLSNTRQVYCPSSSVPNSSIVRTYKEVIWWIYYFRLIGTKVIGDLYISLKTIGQRKHYRGSSFYFLLGVLWKPTWSNPFQLVPVEFSWKDKFSKRFVMWIIFGINT